MKKFDYTIIRGATVFFIALGAIFCSPSYAEEPKPGNRYNIIRPVYLMAVYNTDNRQLSREAASARKAVYANPDSQSFMCGVWVSGVEAGRVRYHA